MSECSLQAGCHFPAFASLAPAGYHVCMNAVWCCFEVCLLPSSCLYPDQFALTHNILGAIRTPPEPLDASSDPCGFMRGDRMQNTITPYIFPLALPPSSEWNQVECIPLGFCVETGWNEETLVDHVMTCQQTQGHNHLNTVVWHACIRV